MNLLTGSPQRYDRVDLYSPQQQRYQQQQMAASQGATGQSADYYKQMLDPSAEAYQRFAAPARQQFERFTIPGIANRFAQGNALRSSGFQNRALRAATDLETNIAAQRAQMQQNAAQGLQTIGQQGQQAATTQQQQIVNRPQTEGLVQSVLPIAANMAANYFVPGSGPIAGQAVKSFMGSGEGVPTV